jgi:hypothetical protein
MLKRGKATFENTGRPSGHGVPQGGTSEADHVMRKIPVGFFEGFLASVSE